jgi:hypothetical protein
MIKLSGSSSKSFTSAKLYQPTLHVNQDFTSHTIVHNLGVTPDVVSVVWDDGRILYTVDIGPNSFAAGYMVHNTNPTSVTIYIFRYAVGYFYVVCTSTANRNFEF